MTAALDPAALQALDACIEHAIGQRRLPGAVLWVERLGTPAYVRAYGVRAWEPEPEPLDLDAVYDVASLTKPLVVGILAAQLVDQGDMQLDAPLRPLLPAFEAGDTLTWRHLLTHASGLPPVLSYEPDWHGHEAALHQACATRPLQPPGTSFTYSDINYILLGELIARCGGASLDALATRQVFGPLGLRDIGYRPLERHAPQRLVPTEFEGTQMLRGQVHDPAARRMGGVAGHAGLFSPIGDVACIARSLLGGAGPLMSAQALALMTRSAAPPGLPARGLGWDIASAYSRPRGALFPMGSFGHTGFTGCAMWLDPHSASFYVLLSNRVHPRGSDSIVAVYEAVGTLAARAVGLGQ